MKIFIYAIPTGGGSGIVRGSSPGGDMMGYALAEDGEGLASHLCSSRRFASLDMSSSYKKEIYMEHTKGQPFELVDLTGLTSEELDKEADFMAALTKHREKYSTTAEVET